MRLCMPVTTEDSCCLLCDAVADRFSDHSRACPCEGDRTGPSATTAFAALWLPVLRLLA